MESVKICSVIQIDFDGTEKHIDACRYEKTLACFVDGPDKTAVGLASEFISSLKPQQFYLGWDGMIYPKFVMREATGLTSPVTADEIEKSQRIPKDDEDENDIESLRVPLYESPVFEFIEFPIENGKIYRFYANGKMEGFGPGVLLNNAPTKFNHIFSRYFQLLTKYKRLLVAFNQLKTSQDTGGFGH